MDDLSADNGKIRKKFSKLHLDWDIHDWNLVVFSDEADLLPVYFGKEYIRLRRSQSLLEVLEPRRTQGPFLKISEIFNAFLKGYEIFQKG